MALFGFNENDDELLSVEGESARADVASAVSDMTLAFSCIASSSSAMVESMSELGVTLSELAFRSPRARRVVTPTVRDPHVDEAVTVVRRAMRLDGASLSGKMKS